MPLSISRIQATVCRLGGPIHLQGPAHSVYRPPQVQLFTLGDLSSFQFSQTTSGLAPVSGTFSYGLQDLRSFNLFLGETNSPVLTILTNNVTGSGPGTRHNFLAEVLATRE
jgi:hypothetical protein